MPEDRFERYEHHGQEVAVRADLKGRHREHCLCFSCEKFSITDSPEEKCPIANLLYAVCIQTGITAPVWECPAFTPGDDGK